MLLGAATLPLFTAASQPVAADYRETADRIIRAAQADSFGYERLAHLTDTFGPRLSGSDNLERAVAWIVQEMQSDGLDAVRTEPVMVPYWHRGEERLTMLEPRPHTMPLLGLGGSIGTEAGGVEAEVLVVRSFEELEQRSAEAAGKIVVYNVPFTGYGETVQYRTTGAIRAARAGAVAALVRSVTPLVMPLPHTGMMRYDTDTRKIPAAAITVEDALMLQRMQDRGQTARLRLEMQAENRPDVLSSNIVAELKGSERPDEVVVMGGHIDSWDVGTGAMDDAGGCVVSWEAVRLLKRLGLRPRRTVRVVLWANEENGLRGAAAYRDAHRDDLDNHVLAIETDGGVAKPLGFGFSGTEEALALIREIGSLLDSIGAGRITNGGGGADIGPIMRHGVPGMGLQVDGTKYFWYHHSAADTVDKIDPHAFNLNVAAMAVMAYVAADMPQRLPRTYVEPTQ